MASLTMKHLNDDVLLNIFGLLDARSLLQATLVCKRWNEVIGSATRTMRRFEVNFNYDDSKTEASLTEFASFPRKVVHLIINRLSEELLADFRFAKIIAKHKTTLKSFQLNRVKGISRQTIMNMLSLMPNLEAFDLYSGELNGEVMPVKMPKLKRLAVFGTILEALQMFSFSTLKGLDIRDATNVGVGRLKDLLSTQLELETVNIVSHTHDIFSGVFGDDSKFNEVSQKLKKFIFTFSTFDKSSADSQQNFIKFLKNRGANLTELKVEGGGSTSTFAFIVTELKSLRKLAIDSYSALVDQNLLERIRTSSAIEELTLLNFVSERHEVSGLQAVRLYETLASMGGYEEIEWAQRMGAVIDSLIDEEETIANNLSLFLAINPTITTLKIKNFNYCSLGKQSNNKLIELITETETLHHVEIHGRKRFLDTFFNYLRFAEWKHLKSLTFVIDERPLETPFTEQFHFKKMVGMPLNCSRLGFESIGISRCSIRCHHLLDQILHVEY